MLYFGQFKGHNARGKKGNYTNDPILSSTFWGKTICDTRFRIWKFFGQGEKLRTKFVWSHGLPWDQTNPGQNIWSNLKKSSKIEVEILW